MAERWQRLLDELSRVDGWITAAELAGRLSVTTRTVRSWVAQANGGSAVVRSGPQGYRLDRAALAARSERAANAPRAPEGPEARAARLIRLLVDADDGLDVFETAEAFHVSESTLDGDLARVRTRLGGTQLSLERRGPTVALTGPELARRRLLGDLLRDESTRGRLAVDALRRRFPELPGLRDALVAELRVAGYAPNEYTLDDVLLHVSIAADRVSRNRRLDEVADAEPDALEGLLGDLVESHLGVRLPAADRTHLGRLLRVRAATRLHSADDGGDRSADDVEHPAALDRATGSPRSGVVREIVRGAASEYLVDLTDDDFIERLALHVDNLAERSVDRAFSRNPLTAQIKSAYPLIYELAVYVAAELGRREGIAVNDDEIAYLAMHLGAHLDRRRSGGDEVRIVVDAPAYHGLVDALVARVGETAGDGVVVESGTARDAPHADLVVAVVPPVGAVQRLVLVSPLPTPDELERVRAEVARIRRARRTARLAARLAETIEPEFFVRGLRGFDREGVIRLLGQRLVAGGVIDPAYVEGAVDRERMSSTAFAEHLAVPHAMSMTARRTAIAIAVDEVPIDWAGTPVHVVAFIAFADSGRAEFQEIFDQFVETFSDRANVLRLVRGATDHTGLVAELARLMEAEEPGGR
ncbi:PTS sugar transporter subunit IIA [Agromyces sp. G08B096]|uniref:PTS sugar transporter subunit IIA n=1 Tax=Agromyces sp. G08B096 TaxID=3156399 RepID=A0AAU7W962_9MICO